MTMGRQKSDGRVVPKDRRKTVPTEATRGGKATTVEKQANQLELFGETAGSPTGAHAPVASGPPDVEAMRVPKSPKGTRPDAPSMQMEAIASEQNLKRAFKRVASNRGAPGPDRQTIDHVRKHLDGCLHGVREALLKDDYRPGEIRRVWIPKPGGGQRGLGIPNVVDRVVQQAVLQVLTPHYEETFHESSHGFRPGRSCHTAIKQAKQYLDEGHGWVVDIDLEKFFDTVNHDRLMARLEQRIADRRVLRLIRRMLQAKVVLPNGVVVGSEEGTPQGGPLSPLLSNIVLDELDRELSRRGLRFVRYADDCNVYVRTERSGQRVMASLTNFIERRMKLRVNRQKSAVAKPQERKFLGFRLQRLNSGLVRVLVAEESWRRLRAKLKELTPRMWGQSIDANIRRINAYLRGWIGYFALGDQKILARLNTEDAHVRRRLRAIVLRHWKRKRFIVRNLIRMGVPAPLARVDVYSRRRGWWALTRTRAVQRGLNNACLEACGLLALHDEWRTHHCRIWSIDPDQFLLPGYSR